jgi:hypothetical protein
MNIKLISIRVIPHNEVWKGPGNYTSILQHAGNILLYGPECWTLTKKQMNRIETIELLKSASGILLN